MNLFDRFLVRFGFVDGCNRKVALCSNNYQGSLGNAARDEGQTGSRADSSHSQVGPNHIL